MNDPKLKRSPIALMTNCRVGSHCFVWTSANTAEIRPPDWAQCECGAYRWDEWQKVMEESK